MEREASANFKIPTNEQIESLLNGEDVKMSFTNDGLAKLATLLILLEIFRDAKVPPQYVPYAELVKYSFSDQY